MKKTVFLICLGLMAALIAAVAVFAVVFDPNDYTDDATAWLGDELGREVSVDRVEFTLYPWLGFKIFGIRVADDARFSESPFLQAAHARVRVRLLPLFDNELEFDRIVLVDPVVSLRRNTAGEANWDSFIDAAGGSSVEPSGNRTVPEQAPELPLTIEQVVFGGFAMQGGRIVFDDAFRGERVVGSEVALEVGAESPHAFRVSGKVSESRRGVRASLQASGLARLPVGQQFPNLSEVELNSTFELHEESEQFQWLRELGVSGTEPVTLTAEAEFDPEGLRGSLERLELDAGAVKATGRIEFVAGDAPQVSGALDVHDISPHLYEALELSGLSGYLSGAKASFQFSADSTELSVRDLSLSYADTAASITLAPVRYSDPSIDAEIEINRLEGDRLADALGMGSGQAQSGSSAPGLFFGIPVSATVSCGLFVWNDIEISNISLAGSAGPRIFDVNVSASGFGGNIQAEGRVTPSEQGGDPVLAASVKAWDISGGALWDAAPAAYRPVWLSGRDGGRPEAVLNVVASASGQNLSAILAGLTARISANFQNGLALRGTGLPAGDNASATFAEPGPLTGGPSDLAGTPDAGSNSPDDVFILSSLSLDAELSGPGTPSVSGESLPLHTDIKLAVRRGGAEAEATLSGLMLLDAEAASVRGVENAKAAFRLAGETSDIPGFTEVFRDESVEIAVFTEARADFTEGSLDCWNLQAEGAGILLKGGLDIDGLKGSPVYKGVVDVARFSPRVVLPGFGIELWETRGEGTFTECSLQAAFEITENAYKLNGINLYLDGATVSGWYVHEPAGIPQNRFSIMADTLNVDRYRPPPVEGVPYEAGDDTDPVIRPDERGALEAIQSLSLEGDIDFGLFRYYSFEGSNVVGRVKAQDGVIHLTDVSGDFHGGNLSGTLTVSGVDNLTFDTEVSAAGFRLEDLLGDLFDYDKIGGIADLQLSLRCTGIRYDTRIRDINGTADLVVTDGWYKFLSLSGGKDSEGSRFNRAVLRVDATDGMVKSRDFSMKGPLVLAEGKGSMDLVRWKIKTELDYRMTGVPTFPIRMHGAIDDPQVDVSIPEMLTKTVGRIGGGAINIFMRILTLPAEIIKTIDDAARGK